MCFIQDDAADHGASHTANDDQQTDPSGIFLGILEIWNKCLTWSDLESIVKTEAWSYNDKLDEFYNVLL